MKIITKPHVHFLGEMVFYPHPEYVVPEHPESQGERLIAHAGKGCYDSYGSDGRSVSEHIQSLIGCRHGSVLEHAVVSLFISGISRGCSHEIVRHRHFAYSQRSTRYTAEEGAAIVLDPYYAELYYHGSDCNCSTCNALLFPFLRACSESLDEYATTVSRLLKQAPEDKNKVEARKWARGKARQLLPHALETRMTMTGNLRAWRHFLEERSGPGAEPEIRRLSNAIFPILKQKFPTVMRDYEIIKTYGFDYYITHYQKV